jgi:hypothetical protein
MIKQGEIKMNKKEYNKIAKENRKSIANDFINFLEEKNMLEDFKSNIICGFTFESVISSGDPKLNFSLYNFNSHTPTEAVKIIEEWKALLSQKYNLIY